MSKSSVSHDNMMLCAVLDCVSYQHLLVINLKEPIKNDVSMLQHSRGGL